MGIHRIVESMTKRIAEILFRYWWVFALVFVMYAPVMIGSYVWDDEQFIYKNVNVRSLNLGGIFTHNTVGGAGVASGYYRPLTSLTFAIDWALAQGNPAWFHLMNVFWHLAAGVALVGLLSALRLPVFIPLLIFLLHPLQTEAVAYISGRGDLLSMFFGFMGMWALALYANDSRRFKLLIFSFVAFALAVVSKESGAVFLGLAILILVGRARRLWYGLLGFGLVALAGIVVRLAVVGANFGFTWDGIYGQSMWIRFLTFTRIFPEYLRLILIPFPLHMERFVPLVTSLISPWPWISLGIIVLIYLAGRKLEIKYRRQYWLGILWFGIFLLPQSGILIPAPALLTEHWLYGSLPGLGLAVDALWRSWGLKGMKYGGFVLLCIWVILGFRQSYLWADPVRFYEYTLRYASTARLHNNLGMHYMEVGRLDDAEKQYQLAAGLGSYAQIHYNLGNLYGEAGRVKEAMREYRKALEIDPEFVIASDRLRLLEVSSPSDFR